MSYKIVEEYSFPSSPEEAGIYQSADGINHATILYKYQNGEEVFNWVQEIFRSEIKGEDNYFYINSYYPHYSLSLSLSPSCLEIRSNRKENCGALLGILCLEDMDFVPTQALYNSRGDILLADNHLIYLFPRQGELHDPVYDLSSPLHAYPKVLSSVICCQYDKFDSLWILALHLRGDNFFAGFDIFTPDLESIEVLITSLKYFAPFFFSFDEEGRAYFYAEAENLERVKKITIDFDRRKRVGEGIE